jgi:hypothetical protein
MGLLTRNRKRRANRLQDMEFDELSLVTKEGNQHSKVVLWKSADGPPDEEDPTEFVRDTDDGGIEVLIEGEWTNLDDLDDDDLEDVAEQLGIDLDAEDDEDEESEDDEDDDEFIELEEDTYEDEAEQEPAMSKLSKSVEVNTTLSKAASDKVADMISKAADDIVAIDDRYVSRPRSERDAIRRVMVMKDNPELYEDYRQLRYGTMQDVAKAETVQRGMEPLMARINARIEAEMKTGITREQALTIVLRDRSIAAAYRQARGIPSGVPASQMAGW